MGGFLVQQRINTAVESVGMRARSPLSSWMNRTPINEMSRWLWFHLTTCFLVPFFLISLANADALDDDQVAAIAAAVPSLPLVKPAKPRRLLVFYGTEFYVHQSTVFANEAVRQMGKRTGAFTADFSDDLAVFTHETLARYDAIVFNNSLGLKFTDAQRAALLSFVKRGKGLIGLHAAIAAFQPFDKGSKDWPEAQQCLGGRWLSHPWHATDTIAVKLDDPTHPLLAAFSGRGFWMRDEAYQLDYAYSRDKQRVLMSLDMSHPENARAPGEIKRNDGDFPLAWIKRCGDGRVFYTSVGHNPELFRNPTVLMHDLAGIQYALGDLPADDTPSARVRPAPRPALAPDRGMALQDTAEESSSTEFVTIPAARTLTPALRAFEPSRYRSWSRSHGDADSIRYSMLDQINRRNVKELQLAWIYHSGPGVENLQANPVIVDGVMYGPAVDHSVVAVDAQTGKEKWRFKPDPESGRLLENQGKPALRGLIYWPGEPGYGPRLYFTTGAYLYALDPRSGRPMVGFGEQGRVAAGGVVAAAIFRHVIVVPVLNVIEGFDLLSGKLLWSFGTLPQATIEQIGTQAPGEDLGGNCWGGMAMDTDRGIAYISTGSPHPNFVGVTHPGRNRYANSVIAIEAQTGKLLWSFQEIRHDIWDLDIPAPPNLVTITHQGKRVDAVAQVTKMGNTLLLDRLSGEPLFPFRLRRAPASTLKGERTWPYQPAPELPEPFSKIDFQLSDVTERTPQAREFVMRQLKDATYGWFEPPALDKKDVVFGIGGGAEWPGASFDPNTGWLYISSSHVPWYFVVSEIKEPANLFAENGPGAKVYQSICATCHGRDRTGRGVAPPLLNLSERLDEAAIEAIIVQGRKSMPPLNLSAEERTAVIQFVLGKEGTALAQDAGAPVPRHSFNVGLTHQAGQLFDDQGYPASKPPWGTLTALDLNTGRIQWRVPLGDCAEVSKGGPPTGTYNYGGATVTAGGLVFIAGTMDEKIRAFDKITGAELWSHKLPFGGYAPVATYEVGGRQYVVVAATGGGKPGTPQGDTYVAFSLPETQAHSTAKKSKGMNHLSAAHRPSAWIDQ